MSLCRRRRSSNGQMSVIKRGMIVQTETNHWSLSLDPSDPCPTRHPKVTRPLAWQCTGGLAFLDLNAPKRPQEYQRTAQNGDSQQAKHHYCHPRNLS